MGCSFFRFYVSFRESSKNLSDVYMHMCNEISHMRDHSGRYSSQGFFFNVLFFSGRYAYPSV